MASLKFRHYATESDLKGTGTIQAALNAFDVGTIVFIDSTQKQYIITSKTNNVVTYKIYYGEPAVVSVSGSGAALTLTWSDSSEETVTINDVAHATTADVSDTTKSVAWANVTGKPNIVTTDTEQTISGAKIFNNNTTFHNETDMESLTTDSLLVTGSARFTNTINGNLKGDVEGNLTGNISGSSTSCSGNSATASKLTNLSSTDTASASATWRKVWFSYNDGVTGRPSLSDSFVYQTSTNTLKVPNLALSGNTNIGGTTTVNKLIVNGEASFNNGLTGTLTGNLIGNANTATSAKTLSGYTGSGTTAKYATENRDGSNKTYYYPAKWTYNTGLTLTNGMLITCEIPVAGHDYGVFISIDNGVTYKPISVTNTGRLTTHFEADRMITLVYDSNARTDSVYTVNGSTVRTNITDGGWRVVNYYDSNSGDYNQRELYLRPYAATNTYRYKLGGLDRNNRFQPIVITNQTSSTIVAKSTNTAEFCVSKGLYYFNSASTINAGSLLSNQCLYKSISTPNIAYYNFNGTISGNRMLYLKGTYDTTTDTFKINGGTSVSNTSWYTQVPTNTANIILSDYFISGNYYWLVGCTSYSNNEISLFINNPLYYFDGTNLVPVIARAGFAEKATVASACFGNSDTATALTTNAGSTNTPVYFTGGKPSSISIQAGSADVERPFVVITDNNELYKTSGITANYSKKSITATTFKGNLEGNASTATIASSCSGNAGTATKLETARTLWGQSFDGSGNVSGSLKDVTTLTASGDITGGNIKSNGVIFSNNYNTAGNTAVAGFVFNKGGDYFGIGPSSGSVSNVGFGTTTGINGIWKSELMTITNSGNVGIGTSSPTSKLHVAGAGYFTGDVSSAANIIAGSYIKGETVKISSGCTLEYDSTQKCVKFVFS